MFKSDVNEKLKLDHSAAEVKAFLNGPFRYYTKLYARIWEATKEETKGSVSYTHLTLPTKRIV